MSILDDLRAKLPDADPSQTVVLKPSEIDIPAVTHFFKEGLKVDTLTLSGASVDKASDPITITGVATIFKYSGLIVELTFRMRDDALFILLEGNFPAGKDTAQLPLLEWIHLEGLGLSLSQSGPYNILDFAYHGNIVPDPQTKIPISVSPSSDQGWQLTIARDSEFSIGDIAHLTALTNGHAVSEFMPDKHFNVLNDIKLGHISAYFNLEQKSVFYFTIQVGVSGGWTIIEDKLQIKENSLRLILTLIDPTEPDSRQIIGIAKGTVVIGNTDVPIFAQATAGSGSTVWMIGLDPASDGVTLPSFSDLFVLAGGESFKDTLPPFLRDIPRIRISKLEIDFSLSPRNLQRLIFAAETTSPWPLIDEFLTVEKLGFELDLLNLNDPEPKNRKTGGHISTTFSITESVWLYFGVQKDPDSSDWSFTGGLPPGKTVNLTDLARKLLKNVVTIPAQAPDIVFDTVGVTIVPGKTVSFTAESNSTWAILHNLEITKFTLQFTYDQTKDKNKFNGSLTSSMTIGSMTIQIQVMLDNSGAAGLQFKGKLEGSKGKDGRANPIGKLSEVVADLAAKLGLEDFPAVPSELDVALASLSVNFHTGKKELGLVAETDKGSKAVVVVSAANTTKFGALIDMKLTIDNKKFGVSTLPLVGETIAAIEDVGIDSLQLVITSQKFDPAEIGELNAVIGSGQGLPAPKDGLAKGIQLGITFFIGDKVQPPLTFQLTGAGQQPSGKQLRLLGSTPASAEPPSEAWIDIQRSFGPVNIKRIGIGYVSPNAVLMLDATLALSGLTLNLDGLGLQFPLKDPLSHIAPNLNGMALIYKSGPLEISGGFLNAHPPPASLLSYEFNGQLRIQAEGFGLSAIGSFAEFKPTEGATVGDKSLFVFGVLNATLGGPAFFVVTGIAAGFGYNRGLTIPTLEQLPGFPLVAAAMPTPSNPSPFSGDKATDPTQAMGVMNQWVYPSPGQNWLAAGIKFTSFKILESFALLTVSFGTRFEIALLGLSNLTMPPLAPKPIGFAQLALEVTYAPDDGVLKVAAQLTPESYILSEACHLTGGFAMYSWFKAVEKDEVHAGDFVVTLGGYSPYFKKPAGYPSVPLVGANWQVSDRLTIKGGFYFALTPVAVMAGGALEANFVSGNFKAWFNAKADFLLYWEPFHYLANLNLSLGASYTLGSGTTAWTITIHVGVDVTLHGPPFGGRAVIDLYIFSIAIDFGPKDTTPQPLPWKDFKAHYLLPTDHARSGGVTPQALGAEPPSGAICFSRVSGGLIKELPPDPSHQAPDWIVNPEKFEIVTASKIPCSEAHLVQTVGKQSSSQQVGAKQITNQFGVTACGIDNGALTSIHTITWQTEDGGPVIWAPPATSAGKADVLPAVTNRLPRAAWFKDAKTDPTEPPSAATINGERVTDELTTGFTLKPTVLEPDAILPIEVDKLEVELYIINEKNGALRSWANPTIPKSDDQQKSPATRMAELAQVDTDLMRDKRDQIVSALRRQGSVFAAARNTQYLAYAAQHSELLAAPILCPLGSRTDETRF
jgi:hypothetical protein